MSAVPLVHRSDPDEASSSAGEPAGLLEKTTSEGTYTPAAARFATSGARSTMVDTFYCALGRTR